MPTINVTNVRGDTIAANNLPELNHLLRRGYLPVSGTVTEARQAFTGLSSENAPLENLADNPALRAAFGALRIFYVGAFGAVPDGKQLTDGAVTSGSRTLTSSGAGFVAGDVGKAISITGAGASGGWHITTIQSVESATSVTLSSAVATSVSPAVFRFGTDNGTAFTSAVTACTLAGGGQVVFESAPGFYLTSSPITLPIDIPVWLRGGGHGFPGTPQRFTQIMRVPGVTTPLVEGIGTGTGGNLRIHANISDVQFHGGDGPGTVLKLQRVSELRMTRTRVGFSSGTLLQATEWFNCMVDTTFFCNGGSGRATPAVVLDAPTGGTAAASGNTIQFVSCEWEANGGTDLRITGVPTGQAGASQDWTLAALFSNIKMERNTGDYPLIDLDRAGATQFSDGFFHLGPSATAPLVEQKGTAVVPGRPNGFVNCQFSANKWNGATTGGAAVVPYLVDVTVGQMLLSNVSMNGDPTTAFLHIGSGVGLSDVRLSNVIVTDRSKLLHDERAGSLYSFGSMPLVPAIAGVAPTVSVNRAMWNLPDSATTTLTMANVPIPPDAAPGRPVRVRLLWYSDVASGAIRWTCGIKQLSVDGEDITIGQTDISITAAVPATANRTTTTLFSSSVNVQPGSRYLAVYISRIGADAADTAAGGGRVLGAEVLYERAM